MESRKIRYGIIGFGLFAERTIAPAIQASPNSMLVAIQKRSLPSAREKARGLPVPYAFSSAEELVSCPDVDAVFIASANATHCNETITAARAGKHVLVEKPMAMNTAEAQRMIEECERHQVKLMVGHVVRFSPAVLHLRDLIRSGNLGRPTMAKSEYIYDARMSKRSWLYDMRIAGGGPIFDIGVHCLDTLRLVLDDAVRSVQCQRSPLPTPSSTERSAVLALEFSKGTLGSITCSFEGPARRIFIEITGTEGVAYAHDFTISGLPATLHVGRRSDGASLEMEETEIDVPNLYVEEVTSFSHCILQNTDSLVPGRVGLENQQVLDLAMVGGGKISES